MHKANWGVPGDHPSNRSGRQDLAVSCTVGTTAIATKIGHYFESFAAAYDDFDPNHDSATLRLCEMAGTAPRIDPPHLADMCGEDEGQCLSTVPSDLTPTHQDNEGKDLTLWSDDHI